MKIPKYINNFLQTLTPNDIGFKKLGNYIIVFEGYNKNCWNAAEFTHQDIQEIENTLLGLWIRKFKQTPITYFWLYDSYFGSENIFIGIFKNI